MKKKRVRIKDIAEESKVSRGTVDRVIHNRGRVASDVKEKVEKAIERLGYSPNLIARTLANNKEYHIATLMPSPEDDPFWKFPQAGIQKAYRATKDFGISIDQFFYRKDGIQSFKDQAKALIRSTPDAILMATEYYSEALAFYKMIEDRDIPMISINTHLIELDKVGYIGQNSYQSGKLAGKLFDISLQAKGDILIIHLGAYVEDAMHLMDKANGLTAYFNQRQTDTNIIKTQIKDYKEIETLVKSLKKIFNQNKKIRGVFVTNSRAHYLARALRRLGKMNELCIIGFDLMEDNCELLKSGDINFLINQGPIRQGNLGILTLVDQLLFKNEVKKTTYLPLDIVVSENVDMYLSNREASLSEVRTSFIAE